MVSCPSILHMRVVLGTPRIYNSLLYTPSRHRAPRSRPDRYVPLFGGAAYDPSLERPDPVPFEEQLQGLEEVVRAGKVRRAGQ